MKTTTTTTSMLLYFSVYYYIIFIHHDAMAIQEPDLLLNDKLSLPKVIKKLENEVLLLTSSHMKSVNDKKSSKNIALSDKHKTAMKNDIKKEVQSYVNHLIFKAFTKLVSQAKYFKSELQYDKDISKLIYNSQRNFSSKFLNYSQKLIDDVIPIYLVDKQFVILDLIETSNQHIFSECREFLMLMHNQSTNMKYITFKYKVFSLFEALLKFIVEIKKEELEYICEHHKICRKCPAYSDYISDLVKEILKLPDNKLRYFIMHLKVAFKEQSNTIKAILSNELASKINLKMSIIFHDDMVIVRNALAKLREILTDKHKLLRSKEDRVVRLSRSMSMLIDMIDKVFDRSDPEILSIYFDNTLQTLRSWGEVDNQDITAGLENFVRYFTDSIKYNWNHETHEEVKVLVEVIMTGNATDENIYDDLFTQGSNYLNYKPDFDLDSL